MPELNQYMQNKVNNAKDALDFEMLEAFLEDANLASEMNVSSDEDYRDFHYIDSFVDSILEQAVGVRLSDSEESAAKKWIYSHRKNFDLSTLDGFYNAVAAWIEAIKKPYKKAYPNDSFIPIKPAEDNTWSWLSLAKRIQSLILKGENSRSAIISVASSLDIDQRYDFMIWYNFRFGADSNKYDLNKRIMQLSEGLMNTTEKHRTKKIAFQFDADSQAYYIPKLNSPIPDALPEIRTLVPDDIIKREKDREALEFARSKLVSRTFAIDKMLEKYRDVISVEQFAQIEDALNVLRKKIRGLKHASTIRDCLLKTAKRLDTLKFEQGKIALSEINDKYVSDLQEKGPFVKQALDQLAPMINDLQIIDAELKRRDIARAISKIDFQLAEMNLAGLFTELSEAQSRLIDAYTYASNKVKEVIPKMRSTQPGITDRPAGPDAINNIRTPKLSPLQEGTPTFRTSPAATPQQVVPKPTAPSSQPAPASTPSAINRLQQGLV